MTLIPDKVFILMQNKGNDVKVEYTGAAEENGVALRMLTNSKVQADLKLK